MYNFADSTVTASAFTAGANTGLTLVASTAGLTTTAALVIYYDDQVAGISGTVTACVFGKESFENTFVPIQIGASGENFSNGNRIGVSLINDAGTEYGVTGSPLSISGMVSVGNVIPGLADGDGTTFGIDRTFPISGTVDIGTALPAGTNRIGVVTIGAGSVTIGAGTAQIGSVTASISGTVPISISSVTVGNSVTIGSLPALVAGTAQIGSVTASLAISSTAITSGSFTSLTSATLVPGNVARKMATVYNLGPGQLFVNAGATATTLGGGFMVALSGGGDFYECDYTTTTLSALFATAGTASWVSH